MDSLKFKAFIKDENKVVDVKELSFKYDEVVYESGRYTEVRRFSDVELMQSTGLKDKNGNEIYEGDIIKGPYDTGIIGYVMVIGEVKYDLLEGFQLKQFDLNRTEILGNVYENPELLKEYKL